MSWKHTLIIVVSILFLGIILGYMMNTNHQDNKKLQQQIIDTEKKAIDSLYKKLDIMKSEREKMESQLDILTTNIQMSESNLTSKINQLKIQNNVKIDAIINSSNDQLLDGLRTRFNQ
jgi:hypothetical protein